MTTGPQGDRLTLWLVLGIGSALGLLWLTGAISAALFGSGWTAIGLGDLLSTAARLPSTAGDPAVAWPRASRNALPGPVGFYLTLGMVSAATIGLGVASARLFGLTRLIGGSDRSRPPATRWASWGDLGALRVRRQRPGRLTLGRQGGTLIAAEALQSAIVIAPTQSGKTTGLAIPALLEWPGPVVATSVKTDLLEDTVKRREELGEVMVYDPTSATKHKTIQATPLSGCQTWHGARRVANWLVTAAREGANDLEAAEFWYRAAEKLLAPMLYAAAASGERMTEVIRCLDAGKSAQAGVTKALYEAESVDARLAWQASVKRNKRQLASIYATAETVLAAFADPRVLASSERAEYTPARLLNGKSNTLYLCAPAHEQERLRPVFSMMVREILATAYEGAAAGEALDPPLLMVLDEAANIAPIPNLDEVASTGAGQGIQLLTVFQSFAQIRDRYGEDRTETIVSNHRAKLFGAGAADPGALEYLERVVGQAEFREITETAGEPGRNSTAASPLFRGLAPASVVREARPGTALLLYGSLPATRIALRPWFRDRQLRALARREVGGHE